MTARSYDNVSSLGALSWNSDFRGKQELDFVIHLVGDKTHLLIH